MEELISQILGFIIPFVKEYPLFATVLFAMGFLRIIFKPLFAFVDAFVLATPTAKDDAAVASFKSGPIYKWVVFAIDYFASIKLVK